MRADVPERGGGGGGGGGVIVRAERAVGDVAGSWEVVMHEVAGLVDGCARWVRLAAGAVRAGELGVEEAERVGAMLETALRGMERLMEVVGRGASLGVGGATGLYGSEGLHRVIAGVVEQLTPMAGERGVCLETRVEAGVLEAGPLPLYGVVANGVRNAIEASRAGGVVRVVAWVEGGRVMLEVRDGGDVPGEAALSRAFCAGWSGKSGGAGVGLAMSKAVVEGLGGEIGLSRDGSAGETVLRVAVPVGGGGGDAGGRMIG